MNRKSCPIKNDNSLIAQTRRNSLSVVVCILATALAHVSYAQDERSSAPSQQKARVFREEKVREVLQRGEATVEVLINLAQDNAMQAASGLGELHEKAIRKELVKTQHERLLSKHSGDKVRVRRKLEMQATVWAEVTAEGLAELEADPGVESIEPVVTMELHDVQGSTLMNAVATRQQFGGAGVAIAIVDSGVDYRHPMLGGGGFPNAKVIGGADTGDNDNDPLPNGIAHGTCCAGIAAGSLASFDDYNGGIAPDSKIYAVKVDRAGGLITNAALIAAWDWCVVHQYDDVTNPIMIISMSIGGGQFFSTCDNDEPAFAQAARNALAAGITIFVSSGNNEFTNAIGGPACLSSVISVGAVYDAAIGPVDCALRPDFNTAADQVTCYSNTAAFLTLFAPSQNAFTTDIIGGQGYSTGDFSADFNGTSAACPYAAGAGAALQSAARQQLGRFLTPAEVKQLLSTNGDLVFDPKAGVSKPRINLGRAIAALTGVEGGGEGGNEGGGDESSGGGPTLPDDVMEDNDSISQAALVSPGTYRLQGMDSDFFVVQTGEGKLTVSIQGPQGDLDLGVNFADKNTRTAKSSAQTNSLEFIEAQVSAGDQVIMVSPYQNQTSGYELRITFTPLAPEPECQQSMCGACTPMGVAGVFLGINGMGLSLRRRRHADCRKTRPFASHVV